MSTGHDVWFTDDAASFLDRAGRVLTADPVTSTVVGSMAYRVAQHGMPDGLIDGWFAVVTGPDREIAGIAMRTAPFEPWPPYLLAMSDEAADSLARAVLARGLPVAGANGLRPATDRFASTVAALTGRRAEPHLHQRLFELGALVDPRPVPGRLRAVRADEAEMAMAWIHQFFRDADEQAGRKAGHLNEASGFGIGDVLRKLDEGVLWFWTDDEDRPVHLTGANPPALGVSRIGPVYTPKEERGRGWAAAAVAEVSRLLRSRGERAILFTDQANPTSNSLYQALGYKPVVDTVQLGMA